LPLLVSMILLSLESGFSSCLLIFVATAFLGVFTDFDFEVVPVSVFPFFATLVSVSSIVIFFFAANVENFK
jgi:hypothetical protein